MPTHPFYLTWSAQSKGLTYELEGVKEHHIISNKKEITDLSSISYQASFGLRPQFILDAVTKQMEDFSIVSPKSVFSLKTSVSNKLIELINLDGGKIFYTVSGAEGAENALKIARLYTGNKTILARRPSYHGATLGAISVTGDWRNNEVPTLDQWTLRIPEPEDDPDLVLTRRLIKEYGADKIAGVILETIPGNNGVLIPPKSWIKGIQKLAQELNILFILDEVICGFYRTGEAFGFQHFDLTPDIVIMGKAITGGVIPFGAIWTNDKIHKHFNEIVLSCGLTNYAHPLGLAALDAILKYIDTNKFKNDLLTFNKQFKSDLESLKNITALRVIGTLAAIDVEKAPLLKDFWDSGLSVVRQEKRIILAPHLNTDLPLWKSSFKILEKLLEK